MEAIIFMSFDEFIHLPLIQFTEPMAQRFAAMRFITGSKFDDRKVIVHTLKGEWFTMHAQKSNVKPGSWQHRQIQRTYGENADITKFFEIRFWDYKGTLFLGCLTFPIEKIVAPIPDGVITQVKEMMDLYHDGRVLCSDCFKVIEATKAGGTLWAGIYCPECWQGKTGKHTGKGGWESEKKKTRVS
ncbi:MAG: hypothetical protein E3J76_02815 [Candidatus Aminicenantes bacterium]|nr:MAG: hypothetical protein E3J76_02815 [Candidatus Aminicenantes bacterium]